MGMLPVSGGGGGKKGFGGGASDHKVKVNSTDPSAGYLVEKLAAAANIALNVLSDHTEAIGLAANVDTNSVKIEGANDGESQLVSPVFYGTGDPPDPTGLPEGSIYLKYLTTLPE